MCIGCHGIPGYKTAYPSVYHVPKIAGQHPAYLVAALKAYKSGERQHPSMRGIAAGAVHAAGNVQNGKAKAAQVCAACHGADGNKPIAPDQPILAGQYSDYLVRAPADYKSGRRSNPVMKGFAAQLSAKDIDDLAAWFASQRSVLHDQR